MMVIKRDEGERRGGGMTQRIADREVILFAMGQVGVRVCEGGMEGSVGSSASVRANMPPCEEKSECECVCVFVRVCLCVRACVC